MNEERPPSLDVAILGDRVAGYSKHTALEPALLAAGAAVDLRLETRWISTFRLSEGAEAALHPYHAVVAAPQSPEYCRHEDGLLRALRLLRESDVPCLAVCGGAQYALREAAARLSLDSSAGVLRRVGCVSGAVGEDPGLHGSHRVRLRPGSRAARTYGRTRVEEPFSCSSVIEAAGETALRNAGIVGTGRTPGAGATLFEAKRHTFHLAALFVPHWNAEQPHPLFVGLLQAAASRLAPRPVGTKPSSEAGRPRTRRGR